MPGAREVAFATCSAFPDGTTDDRLAIAELGRRGVKAAPAIWNDSAVDWSVFAAVVIRSTWDYFQEWERFLRWIGKV